MCRRETTRQRADTSLFRATFPQIAIWNIHLGKIQRRGAGQPFVVCLSQSTRQRSFAVRHTKAHGKQLPRHLSEPLPTGRNLDHRFDQHPTVDSFVMCLPPKHTAKACRYNGPGRAGWDVHGSSQFAVCDVCRVLLSLFAVCYSSPCTF